LLVNCVVRIIEFMTTTSNPTKFHSLLQEQVRHEFTASQQYIALAVWFDGQDLPQLAKHFYRQALEERNHAMMIVQYLLDNDLHPAIPGVDEVRNDFSEAADLVALALKQEKEVTDEIIKLAKVVKRSNGNLFDVETFLARESVGDDDTDALAPHAAGGSV
jgi:ferritin